MFKTRALEEKTKLTELKVEEAFLVKRQMADHEAGKLKTQPIVAKARARTKIFEESEVDNKFLHRDTESPDKQKFVVFSQSIQRASTGTSHHERSKPSTKYQKNVTNNIQSKGQDVTEILCKLEKQQSAPDLDLDVFDGNP